MNITHKTNKEMMNEEEGLLPVTKQRDREMEERRKKKEAADERFKVILQFLNF